jgi:uncharacterized ParB-like nuclease family protein
MKQSLKLIDVQKIKSKWYKDILTEWNPNKDHIRYIKNQIVTGEYIAPIVVVQEGGDYFIVNGHHRYYAHVDAGEKKIKCIIINGSFEDSEPLRRAEVLLKEFDKKTDYRYQLSGYLDRWSADAENHVFINKYRPIYKVGISKILKLFKKLLVR